MDSRQGLHALLVFVIGLCTTFTGLGQTIAKTSNKLKIACVGNSITYGARVANREKNAYPAQLQYVLGDDYEVKNFGVSGATLLQKGDLPYWQTDAYAKALEYRPDMVFIKLGTNDSKAQNRIFLNDFKEDYTTLIKSFKNRNPRVRIVMLLLLPSFAKDSTKIWNPVIRDKIIPMIQEVAYDTETEVIDLYQLFIDRPDLLPDTIHPSGLGASLIAKRLYETVVMDTTAQNTYLKKDKRIIQGKRTNFYGFSLTNFKYRGVDCKLARPRKVAKGMPWVLRARFWGHEPQADIALLERGFHIAYCDVSNLYGSDEAISRWNVFYKLMTEAGFSKKVALEGMSRGGLIIYNWAEKNPEKVACIYADAPVLDGKSWPGGLGSSKGSPEDWASFKKVYGLLEETDVKNFKGNPIHKIKSIAKGGYPILHVCGETDKVVPVSENTVPFETGIKRHGGDIKTIYKPDNGHHPHSLENPKPIVDFILQATEQKLNFADVPAPSAEYRSAAGWTEGTDWWTQASDIDSLCSVSGETDLLLIGNSITQGFGGNRPHVTYSPGKSAADTYFKKLKWVNAGISGDRTQHILWRIREGSYGLANPKTVVLTVGVNNFPFQDAKEIVAGIEKVLQRIEHNFPDAQLLFFGPLPTGTEPNSNQRKIYRKVHELLGRSDFGSQVSYHEISNLLVDEDGHMNADFYSEDGIHLKPKGYDVWAKYIRRQIDKMVKNEKR